MSDAQLLNSERLAQAYYQACLAEIEALKPGNVHIFADGHGMAVQDFIRSAEVSAPLIAQAELTLGQRIFLSVEATWQAVNCNTNLGIILLCAPLIQASLTTSGQNPQSLKNAVSTVIASSTQQDAQSVFDAIKLAKPAGLGAVAKHDVNKRAQENLLNIMQVAADKDLIARQYAHGLADIVDLGLPYYRQALLRWGNTAWATTALYLYWMANFPDSHVQRKYGLTAAQNLQVQANEHLAAFDTHANPKSYQAVLMQFDQHLKSAHINPGTSADLTVATLLAHAIFTT